MWFALVTGLRDYVHKNGFRSITLGLSGGIDSAVVAAIAADALGGGSVYGVSLPSNYSSDHSKDDAAELARRSRAAPATRWRRLRGRSGRGVERLAATRTL